MAQLIVLVDPSGDVLFSGESVIAMNSTLPPPPAVVDLDDETCPETMRSATSESGVFASFRIAEDAVDTVPENPDEIRSSRPRAA
jgi:hypothetical protein